MQVVLKAKKEIKFANEIEFIFNELYPELNVKVKISPIVRKKRKSIIVGNNEVKVPIKEEKQIKIKSKVENKTISVKENNKKERKIYDIHLIEFIEDKMYKEQKYNDEMKKVMDKFLKIKNYQY